MIWGNSRMIIAPFCLYFRLIHFIFSSKTQKIVFNKLEYRVSNKRAKSLLETETAFINNGNNKCKNNRPLFSDEETINITGSSIDNINIQFYYFIHTIG